MILWEQFCKSVLFELLAEVSWHGLKAYPRVPQVLFVAGFCCELQDTETESKNCEFPMAAHSQARIPTQYLEMRKTIGLARSLTS